MTLSLLSGLTQESKKEESSNLILSFPSGSTRVRLRLARSVVGSRALAVPLPDRMFIRPLLHRATTNSREFC